MLHTIAPDFTLFNQNKEQVNLSALKGQPIVLLFFPLAFTGVCTKELCQVRDEMAQFNKLNAKVYGISVDSLFSLAKFKEEQGFNFDLLSDFNKEVSAAYQTIYADFVFGMKGVSKRSAFVIDAEGRIQYAEVLEDAGQIPDFNAILSVLDKIS